MGEGSLEIEILREWDEDGVHFEEMYFTGQITYGVKTRVYAFRGVPSQDESTGDAAWARRGRVGEPQAVKLGDGYVS